MKSACANYTKLLQYHKKKRGSSICGAANLHSGAHLWVDVPCISADVITYIKLRNVQHIAEIDTKNPLEYFLLREHVKSISAKNRDELKKNKSKVNELLSSGKSLKLLSAQENMATSDVALALLGRKYLKKENPQVS